MHVARLNRLATILELLAADEARTRGFHLRAWMTVPADEGEDPEWIREVRSKSDRPACNTTACAFGEACLDPEFQAEGLSLSRAAIGCLRPVYVVRMLSGHSLEFTGIEAAEVFFEIDAEQARHLFMPDHYFRGQVNDPLAVAARIRSLIGAA